MENLQEEGGWHYNVIDLKNQGFGGLTESQAKENLDTKIPDGRTFRTLFGLEPNICQTRLQSNVVDENKKKFSFKGIDGWLLKQKVENIGRKVRVNSETPLSGTQSLLDHRTLHKTAKQNPKINQNAAIQIWRCENKESTPI